MERKLCYVRSVDIETHGYSQSSYCPISATVNCDFDAAFFVDCKDRFDAAEKIAESVFRSTNYIPKRILRSGPCTIVFWEDGTKTMVRRAMDEETDSPYEAFTAALAIKIFGSNSAVKRTVKNKLVEQIKKPKNNA